MTKTPTLILNLFYLSIVNYLENLTLYVSARYQVIQNCLLTINFDLQKQNTNTYFGQSSTSFKELLSEIEIIHI